MIDKKLKEYQEFGEFLQTFIRDLNHLSEAGWGVFVEGKRDAMALRKLGFRGEIVSSHQWAKKGPASFQSRSMVILTDLDREGAALASRTIRALAHDGVKISLAERRRLRSASKGVFRHVENLARFAADE